MATPNLSTVPRNDDPDRKFLAALRASPAGMKVAGDLQAAETKRRTLLAAEIVSLDEKAERELPPLRAAAEAAQGEALRLQSIVLSTPSFADPSMTMQGLEAHALEKVKARGALAVVGHEAAVARAKSSDAATAYASRRGELEQQMRATASPAIKIFRDEMIAAHDETRRSSHFEAREIILKDGRRSLASNGPSIARRLAALREAIRLADDLAFLTNQTDIDVELEKIRQSLPPIGGPEVSE